MKAKTPKSISKRLNVKPGKKNEGARFEFKPTGQNHFNGKENGTVTRRKRTNKAAHKANQKNLKTLLHTK